MKRKGWDTHSSVNSWFGAHMVLTPYHFPGLSLKVSGIRRRLANTASDCLGLRCVYSSKEGENWQRFTVRNVCNSILPNTFPQNFHVRLKRYSRYPLIHHLHIWNYSQFGVFSKCPVPPNTCEMKIFSPMMFNTPVSLRCVKTLWIAKF